MRSAEYDVIVVGLGAMGSAACWRLASRGHRVLGLERNGIPNNLGASHGMTRMIRKSYYEHEDYVPLLHRAYELWHELESESGANLLHLTGGLYIGASDTELITGSRRAAEKHSLPHELLSRSELAARFPQFVVPDDYVGFLEQEGGYIEPEIAVSAMAEQALRRGADLRGVETVEQWAREGEAIAVTTNCGVYRSAKLILCAGPWSQPWLSDVRGLKLTVTRQVMGWVWPNNPRLFQAGPVWAIGHADGSLHYGFPMMKTSVGLKVAHHAPGVTVNPDTVDRSVTADDIRSYQEILERFIPEGRGPTLSARVCLYTYSPDSHFVIDRHPADKDVLFACGFSGHGFKFAPVIGEALADLALTDSTALPVSFLGSERLANGF